MESCTLLNKRDKMREVATTIAQQMLQGHRLEDIDDLGKYVDRISDHGDWLVLLRTVGKALASSRALGLPRPVRGGLGKSKVMIVYKKLYDGGASRVVCDLARLLWQNDVPVVLGCQSEPDRHYDLPGEVPIVELPTVVDGDGQSALSRAKCLAGELRRHNVVKYVITDNIPKNYVIDLLACCSMGVWVTFIDNGHFAYDLTYANDRRYRLACTRWALSMCDEVITVSNMAADWWRMFHHNVKCANPLPTETAIALRQRDLPRLMPYQCGNSYRFAYIGRMDPNKQTLDAIKAFAIVHQRLPGATLDIWGSVSVPVYGEWVTELIQELDLADCVTMHGYTDDPVNAYIGADAMVVTSRCEGYCLSMLEACAIGMPVICYYLPNVPFCGDGAGNACFVEQRDYQALAQAMIDMATASSDELRRRQEYGRNTYDAQVDGCYARWLDIMAANTCESHNDYQQPQTVRMMDSLLDCLVLGLDRTGERDC